MNKKTAIAVMAAAAFFLGVAEASACNGGCGGGGGGGSQNPTNVHNDNHNVAVNNNFNRVSNNNNNYNRNTNLNANFNNNQNTNNNTNTNTNTNNNTNTNTNTNTNNNDSNASSNSSGNSTSVSVGGDEAAASGAAPVYLTSSNDTCMGSSGVGGQGMSFGFSLGTTWTDSNCIMLKNARELQNQGHEKAAKARLCMDDDNAMAFELAGEPCPRALESSQAAVAKVREWNPGYMTASTAGAKPGQTQTAARRIVPATGPEIGIPE
jgi:hypothetical protein